MYSHVQSLSNITDTVHKIGMAIVTTAIILVSVCFHRCGIYLFERSSFSNGDLAKKKSLCVCVYSDFHWSIGSQSREVDLVFCVLIERSEISTTLR